ncbi:MAG TPA: VOC family protein [Longimicrobium sp.]|nr:VOC family protein [Longimicrobium sp.]
MIAFTATSSPERSRTFYQQTLGLRLVSEDGFAIVFDANGVMLRVQKVQAHTPPPYTVLGWDVPDVHAAVEELAGRGVTFERFEGMAQDHAGVWTSPAGGRIAWFRDPDGNTLSLTQFR